MFRKNYFPIFVAAIVMTLFAGCAQTSTIPDRVFFFVYKIDLQQGNALKPDMIAKLRAGMTPSQVRYVLGAPLLIDPFRNNRWDYVYLYEKRGKVTEQHRLTVFFDNEKLARVDGDLAGQATLLAPVDAGLNAGIATMPASAPVATTPPTVPTTTEMPASSVTPTTPKP